MKYSKNLFLFGQYTEQAAEHLSAHPNCPASAALLSTARQFIALLSARTNKTKAITAKFEAFKASFEMIKEQKAAQAADAARKANELNAYGVSEAAARKALQDNVCVLAYVLANDSQSTGLVAGDVTLRIATRNSSFYPAPNGERKVKTALPYWELAADFKDGGRWKSASLGNIVAVVPLSESTSEAINSLSGKSDLLPCLDAMQQTILSFETCINTLINQVGGLCNHISAVVQNTLKALPQIEFSLPLFVQQSA